MFSEKDTSDMMSDTGITSSAPQLVQIAVTGLMDTQPMDHLESGSEQEGTGLLCGNWKNKPPCTCGKIKHFTNFINFVAKHKP